uniref:Receptor protein-tyrosine kinase n=1 Tax=Photinus pyralis TaxID=7054 RepID=A0A1Y1KDU2_PHOPY
MFLVPGPPQDLEVSNVTDTTAFISWKPPKSFVDIDYYEIKANVLHTFAGYDVTSPVYRFSNNTFETERNFQPGTKYNLTLRAASKFGKSAVAFRILETAIGFPDNIPSTPNVLKRHGKIMIIQLSPVVNNNGPVSAYRIVVVNENMNPILQVDNFKSYKDAMAEEANYYIAAEIEPQDILKNFTVGDGKTYGSYYNAPLQPNTIYRVLLGVVSRYLNVTRVVYSNTTDPSNTFVTVSIMPAPESDDESPALIIGLSVAIGLLSFLLILGIVGFFLLTRRISNRRRRLTDVQELSIQGPIIEVENSGYIPEDEIIPINHYHDLKQQVWSIPQTLIKFEPTNLLGSGKFGRVNSGTVRKDSNLIQVAIYTIPDRKLGHENKRAMLKDLDLLIRSRQHCNILNLIGTCETPDTLFVVLEYASTNLKDLLLGSRDALPGRFSNMQESQAFDISIGIAKGMHHLQSLRIVHRQLCARNVLITNDFLPKVSGYGLAQYCNPNMVPDYTRWTAAEIFRGHQHVSKSDVWSFACLVWEICVLGGTPYSSVPNNEIPERIVRGLRLVQMRYFSDELYQLMLNCWQLDLDERPTFQDLIETLTVIKGDSNSHLNFNVYPEFQYEQFYPNMEMAARTFH